VLRALILAASTVACGCGKKSPSPEVRDFRAKSLPYLDEARAGAELLKSSTSTRELDERARSIKDPYSRTPAVPAELAHTGVVATVLAEIEDAYLIGADSAKAALVCEELLRESPGGTAVAARAERCREKASEAAGAMMDDIEGIEGLPDEKGLLERPRSVSPE
jgi:hypothetical protein